MCGNLQWTIRLYPCGNNRNSHGSVKIFLKLVSMPEELEQIHLSYTTLCPQSQASSTALDIYVKSGDSKGWLNRSLLLREWQSLNVNALQIVVSIHIFRLKFKHAAANRFLSHYRFNPNESFPSCSYPRKSTLRYKLDSYSLEKFRHSYFGKRYESSIFNNMWRIRWFPNGANEGCENFLSIYLVLCRLPYNTEKITTKYRITCEELQRSITAVDDFSFSASNWGKSKFIPLSDIHALNTLTFVIDLEVLQEVPCEHDDDVVWDEHQIEWTLSATANTATSAAAAAAAAVAVDDDARQLEGRPPPRENNVVSSKMQKEVRWLKRQMREKNTLIEQLSNRLSTFQTSLNSQLQQLQSQQQQVTSAHYTESFNVIEQKLAHMQLQIDHGQQQRDARSSRTVSATSFQKQQQLKRWMSNTAELPQYFECFVQNGFEDLQSLKDLTKSCLKHIGVDKIGHQLKLLRLVRGIRHSDNSQDTNECSMIAHHEEDQKYEPVLPSAWFLVQTPLAKMTHYKDQESLT
eukprot:CAMPEP_0202690050 /NCGR_PEP_ID=MMETSP1385-20130828/5181_1 /ASSEMBLY_ACC=CAM_ASM_000861 /TAXON_ID=933848 /ORGANISM="Elphidium margaritaceum" /LENGTH=518 /DNA_ID=CAMNT_0049345277 /DNA_START=190 /DNA_END=1747 /DNA_ORIENTATION=+